MAGASLKSDCCLSCLRNKLSNPNTTLNQQHTTLGLKVDVATSLQIRLFPFFKSAIPTISLTKGSQLKYSIPPSRGRNGTFTCAGRTCAVCSYTACLCHHPISERSARTPDRRRQPGSTPCPPAPVLLPVGPGPPPARSSSIPESSGKPASLDCCTPHCESLGLGCSRIARSPAERCEPSVNTLASMLSCWMVAARWTC